MYRLVALSGADRGREWALSNGRNVVGRSPDVGVHLRDARASRNHCAIDVGDALMIEDLGSLNSTRLNGSLLKGRATLAEGDRIGVGETELVVAPAGRDVDGDLMTTVLQKEIRKTELREFEREMLAHGLVGRSPAIRRVLDTVARVAPTDTTVLIAGPTGCGKELVASALHYNSPRRNGHFVAVNCAALPESLLESELFGHERGAFTGAIAPRAGKFQYASGGTIFLDEIGDMPLGCQAKILRVMQERSYSRLGSNALEQTDCRVVAATNRDLEAAVKERAFREDLYYRVKVISIDIPPLAERVEDIEMLAVYFLERLCLVHQVAVKSLSSEAVTALNAHQWPGNVRELQNRVERAVLLGGSSVISPSDLGLSPSVEHQTAALSFVPCSLRELEKEHILKVLEYTGGNKKKAAELLGIERNTLYDRLRLYGVPL